VNKKKDEPSLVHAARELHAALEEVERLTSRSIKQELATRSDLLRAGELLDKAASSHRLFLQQLVLLTQAVGELRDRQNASAEKLSRYAEELDGRRLAHEALDRRFAEIGDAANEIGVLIKAGMEGQGTDLGAVRERLKSAVESSRALWSDAREAGFAELERQAHAMRQQLQALLQKVEEIDQPAS
jgi:hypothetical protein